MRIKEAREGGEKIEFGDASRREILLVAGIEKAKLLIITFNDLQRSLVLLGQIRAINPNVKVLVRTKNDKGLDELHEAGATEVVPEVLEGSLMLVAHVLFLSGIPRKKIMQRLDCERRIKYQHLHGFYYGQDSRSSVTDSTIEKIHAVVLPEFSKLIDSNVNQFNFSGVIIKSIHRQTGEKVALSDKTHFKSKDVVLLQGNKMDLLKAEQVLLK